jgi:hypothetical protein
MQLGYDISRAGDPLALVTITGRAPVNDPANLLPPVLEAQGTTADLGGSVPGAVGPLARGYWIAAASRDAGWHPGPVSKPCHCVVAQAGDDNTITADVKFWDPDGTGYFVFVGTSSNRLVSAASDAGYDGAPASITVDAIPEATWGAPDGEFDRLIARPSICEHAGVFGAVLTGVGTRTLTITGAGWNAGWWVGYDCMVAAKADLSPVGVLNFRVASNTADTLTIETTSPDPAALGVAAGDVLVMLSKPTVAGLVLSDARWENTLSNAGLGLTVDEEAWRILRVIAGPGRGYRYKIRSNTATAITIDGPWVIAPDSTSRYVIEAPDKLAEIATQPIANADQTAAVVINLPVANFAGQTLCIEMVTVDGGGAESAPQKNPVRVLYVPGAQGTRTTAGNDTQRATDGTLLADTSGGAATLQLLPSTAVQNQFLLLRNTSSAHAATAHTATGYTFPDGSTDWVLPGGTDAVLLMFPDSGSVVVPIGGGGGGGVGGGAVATHLVLTVATTTVNSPGVPADGDGWAVRIDQDATGGRAVIWGTDVMLGPLIDATTNSDPSTMCIMKFTGFGGKWYCGVAVLGVAIV